MLLSKRLFDVLIAAFALFICAPLFLALAILIKLDSRGPVFFRGTRVGKDGVLFSIYKFRTMVSDAAQRGAGITTRNDPRITRVGKFLRRSKLDELPQLWNVLRGEMSLVGPRPEDPRYLRYYSPAQRAVLRATPGITSVASLAFRHEEQMLEGAAWEETYIQRVLPAKLDLELAYLQRRTFWSDLAVLGRTGLALFG
jgi:lipopolysaccharide/colanic/teichoic acid biosynthesis glycosyltransferase